MLQASIPDKIPAPFASANLANANYPLPLNPPGGGLASWLQGWTVINATAQSAGGIPPFWQDFLALAYTLSAWDQWDQAGGALSIGYDSAFSANIGGYFNGSIIKSATANGLLWISQVDNNTSDPDTGGANWTPGLVTASSNRANAVTMAGYTFAGNPNGNVAGTAATATSAPDLCWDRTHAILYACTVTGGAAAAVWTAVTYTPAAYPANTVIIGSGASGFNTAGPGNLGVPLIGQGPSNPPVFSPINVSVNSGPSASIIGVGNVANGFTGNGNLTAHALLVGEGTNPVNTVGPAASGVPLLAQGAASDPAFGPLNLGGPGVTGVTQTPNGGTGINAPSPGVVLVGNGAGALQQVGPGTVGQLYTSNGPGVAGTFANPNHGAQGYGFGTAFAAPGVYNFTVPAGVFWIWARLPGAGGGGGWGLQGAYGSSGAGGGYCESLLSVVPNSTITIILGAGGAGGISGSPTAGNGGVSSISGSGFTTMTSNGGLGGALEGGPTTGGAASGGNIANIQGGPGGTFWIQGGAAGGLYVVGPGGNCGNGSINQPGAGGPGGAGVQPGMGGNGGAATATNSYNGGAGANAAAYLVW
jgi:hypothetical protein